MKAKKGILIYFAVILVCLVSIGLLVYKIDPYFHYHKPKTDKYFYNLSKERAQNYGIAKYFDYDAMIIGTSMTECFKNTEFDELFGVHSVKTSFEGGYLKEIDENLKRALEFNPNVKIVIRDISPRLLEMDKDEVSWMAADLPTYLYDDNPLTDIKYLYNKSVMFDFILPMMDATKKEDFESGIMLFDWYHNWSGDFTYGTNAVIKGKITGRENENVLELSKEERKNLLENLEQNVIATAKEHEDVTFYYYFPLYSMAFWDHCNKEGRCYKKYAEILKTASEEMLKQDNIKLFCFYDDYDVISNLNNYEDVEHSGDWVNSLILKYMSEDGHLLTKDNYEQIIDAFCEYIENFDYDLLLAQEDYSNDKVAAAYMREKITGIEPYVIDAETVKQADVQGNASIETGDDGSVSIVCRGVLDRSWDSEEDTSEYVVTSGGAGIKIRIEDIGKYDYLVFYGQKMNEHGQALMVITDNVGNIQTCFSEYYGVLDGEKHDYYFNVSELEGEAYIILNGAYSDSSGSPESEYVFSKIGLY